MVAANKKTRRKIIKDLAADAKKAEGRKIHLELGLSGLYPLNAPGIPLPGPDFVEQARRLGEETEIKKVKLKAEDGSTHTLNQLEYGDILYDLHRRALREPGFQLPVQVRPGFRKNVVFVPGHIWGQHAREYEQGRDIPVDGPHVANVMVIGKMPGEMEEREGRNLLGESGKIFVETLRDLHVRGTPDWYVTNLVKFRPPDGSTNLKASWIKDCLPLLHQELRLVRPQYILCLGADATKALLGAKYNISFMDGRVIEYEYPVHVDTEDPDSVVLHKCLVMSVVHPAQVARAPEMRRQLERGLARFKLLSEGVRFDQAETDIDHRTVRTLSELRDLLEEVKHDPEKTDDVYAIDAEWHGEHPVNAGSYVRTVQFAWRAKHACSIVLHDVDGKCCFVDDEGRPAIKRAMKLLTGFFADKRVVGHFFVADLEWLVAIGLDLRSQFYVPLYDEKLRDIPEKHRRRYHRMGFMDPDEMVPAWVRCKHEGGADTGLMFHAIEETSQLGLESLTLRYTTCPRYDIPLYEWRDRYCKEHNIKSKDLEGYGPCPDDIIVPYGCYDADATLRIYYEGVKLLDCDYDGNNCWEPFWESMITTLPILEVHMTGIPVDKKRIDRLTTIFMSARAQQEQKIQQWAKWPDFNIRSVMQVREFLFGHQFNGKKTRDGEPIRIRPDKARCLAIEPLLDTSKPPKQWREIREKGLEDQHSPGTSKSILAILAQENLDVSDQINWIRDYRFLDQVLKSLLRPPVTDDDGNFVEREVGTDFGDDSGVSGELGGFVYEAGLASVICDDGRVRTHLYPTAETGRWKSARPNLQNISKQRDADYERILGKELYKHKLRSILKTSPGNVIIEADYVGAELYGMAVMTGDPLMIEHASRNQLPEDDPNYYDIHSNVAVLSFRLNCLPTKEGLADIGKKHLRIVAKSVIFGIAYGRGAKAIALAAKEQGVKITVDDAQRVIDTIFQLYPGLVPFFEQCKRRAVNDRWLCHCFGRFRRFPYTTDAKLLAEFERQAMNFPIQGMIASAMDRAVAYLYDYRRRVEQLDMYKILLQIHDAVLLEVPYHNVEFVVDEVLPYCMCQMVPIYPSSLDGVPTGDGPYHLGIDREVFVHWGEKITEEQCERWGVPVVTAKGTRIAAKPKKAA